MLSDELEQYITEFLLNDSEVQKACHEHALREVGLTDKEWQLEQEHVEENGPTPVYGRYYAEFTLYLMWVLMKVGKRMYYAASERT